MLKFAAMGDCVVPAGEVSDLLPFKPHPLRLSEVDQEEVNHCHVTQEGAVLLMSCGPRHHSYTVRTGCLNTTWRFGRKSPSDPVAGPWVYMKHGGRYYTVVAVDGNDAAPHLLCVCHMESGKTLKAIRIPAPASHICLVDDGENEDTLPDCPAGFMRGCIAVSTKDGQVFLVDLCLGQEKYSSEEYPVPLKFFHGAPSSGSAHGAIFVFGRGSFLENDSKASLDDVDVTCLEYLPQLCCLAIGLSTGAIHLWSLLSGSAILELKKSPTPVVALMLQEPENDPRRWCYLWVINGAKGSQRATSLTTCAMFSLDFAKKAPLDSYKFLYEGLTSCHQVFECTLGPNMTGPPESPSATSRLISCRIMLQAETFGTGRCNMSDFVHTTDWHHDLNLMLLSWELLQGSQSLGTYLTIFDMNQWYQAQMPPAYRCRNGHLSSYLGTFSLKEAVHGSSKVLDVHVVSRSVTKFHSTSGTADQHHFPSTLACKCVCVTERGIVHVTFLGLQRQLFQNLNLWGPNCLLSPKELYLRCCHLGLLSPDFPRALLDQSSMQKALLGMALDNRLKGFLLSCVKQWAYSQDEDNPGLSFFMNWCWDRVKEDKAAVDHICGPLFDCLGQELSQDNLQRLAFINKDLKSLRWLFKHCSSLEEVDIDILNLRCEVVERIEEYVAVLLFLISCGILPDRAEGIYPGTFLTTWYQGARRTSPLLMDSIMETVLGGATPPWGCPYPASTVQEALTGFFLMHDLPDWGPRVLMLYLILDLASALMESHPHVVEALKAFPMVFKMSNSLQWFVQGCWHLDHSLYEKGLDQLLQAWESPLGFSSLFEALKRPILRQLSTRPKLALQFLSRVPFPAPHTDPELLSLHLDVLLADRRVSEALSMVRRSGQPSDMKDFFQRVISISKPEFGTGTLLRILLEYPLSPEEESMLECMLQRSGDSRELAVLALHRLRAGRTYDATRVAVALRNSLKRTTTQQVSGGMYAAVLALVQNFADLVPSVSRSSSTFRRVAMQEVHLSSPMQVLPKEVSSGVEGLRFAVGSSTAALQTRQDNRRQKVLFPRPTATSTPLSRDSQLPCKTPKVTEEIQRRKSHVTSTILEDALSVLHTPPTKRSIHEVCSLTPHPAPPSILKSRLLCATQGGSMTIGTSPPPTPPLPEISCSTPDTTSRKLRFAVTDSSPSEINIPVADLNMSSQRDMPEGSYTGTPCSDLEAMVEDQSRLSFVTADDNSDNANSAMELHGDDAPASWMEESAAQHSSRASSSPSISLPVGGLSDVTELPEDVESSPELIVEKVAHAESAPEAEPARVISSEKSTMEIDFDSGKDEHFPVITPRKGAEAAADQHDDDHGTALAPCDTGTLLVQDSEVPMYIPGMPTSQDVFDVLHSVTPQYDKAAFSCSLSEDYLLMANVDPRGLSPPTTPKRDDDDDSEGTPLKDSSEKRLSPEANRDVKKRLFEGDCGLAVAQQFPLGQTERGMEEQEQQSHENESEELDNESLVRQEECKVSGNQISSEQNLGDTSADNGDNQLTATDSDITYLDDRKRIGLRCRSEEPTVHRTIVTRRRRYSEASDDRDQSQGSAEMGSRSETSLLSSELGEDDRVITRRRSMRLLDISARRAQSPKLSEKKTSQLSAIDGSDHSKKGGVELEAHKAKKTSQSPSRKSHSQPQLHLDTSISDESSVHQRTTPQRSEEPSNVTVRSARRRRSTSTSLADSAEFDEDRSKPISTPQSLRKKRQPVVLDTEKASPSTSNREQHFVQEDEGNVLKSTTPSKKNKKMSGHHPAEQQPEEQKDERKESQLTVHRSRTVADLSKDDGISSKQETASTTPLSPIRKRRRSTPRKRDSPVPESSPQRGASSKGQLRTLEAIPEDSETVAQSTAQTPKRTQTAQTPKRSERSSTRRRSIRLLETIPEGTLGASDDNETLPWQGSPEGRTFPSGTGNTEQCGTEQQETKNQEDTKDSRRTSKKRGPTGKRSPEMQPGNESPGRTPPKEHTPTRSSPRGQKRTPEETTLSLDTAESSNKLSASKRKGRKSVKEAGTKKMQANESGEDTFKLSAPAYLSDKNAVVPPEAESKIFIFSPPLTRYRSSLLPEVFKKPQSKAEEAKSDGIKLVAPLLSPPPPRQAPKRRKSSATIASTKLVNTIKRRSLRLPTTPRRLTQTSSASPGSPWTVIKPKDS
ncbi:protein ELYS-like isoform X2 [Ornithodoros turicata]|uniref:protein ELYS-like isoform X2 n=1 Tax=Ornithodoros turicata TaxID=34597 RepID=UPI00313A1BA6